jgi:tRNA-intron endonuclease
MQSPKTQIYQIGNNFFSNQESAMLLTDKSFFGELKDGKVIYSIYEALYLLDKNKAELINTKNDKKVLFKELIKNLKDPSYYFVFKDLRDKGMIVKEGLKFGTDFRVYDKNQVPGKNHAKYLLYILESKDKINLKDLTSKARVANSTSKALLLAIKDSEGDINYYEINWKNLL